MRKLALGLAILFLVLTGCDSRPTRLEAKAEANRVDPPTVLTVERLDFPSHKGGSVDALQFEVEFSDGTKAGCVYIWSGVTCVKLGGY